MLAFASVKNGSSENHCQHEQFITGTKRPLGKKKYNDCAIRVRRILIHFEHRDILDYLTGIAHN